MRGSRCPGHGRHWFAPAVYVRSPTCVRCGAPNPRPLNADETAEYEQYRKLVEDMARRAGSHD